MNANSERGQVLLIVATAVLFVMLGATALAVDWGNGLLQKRRLQNTADAAALAAADVIGKAGSVTTAVAAAQQIVTDNTNGSLTLTYPGTGSGANLSDGLEIDVLGGDVRVALSRQVNTFFAPILGVNNMSLTVKAHAIVGPYGVMPITIKRFTGGNTSLSLSDTSQPSDILDVLAPAKVPDGTPGGRWNYLSGSWPPLTDSPMPEAGYTPVESYDPMVSGPVMPIVGRNALANTANSMDFHFFVAPDIRDITHSSPTFYNGVALPDTSLASAQQIKNITSDYILAGGYPGPNPLVGEQLGTFSGAPTDQAVDAMRQVFKRGDIVTAMVYDGTVYRKPAFDLRLDAPVKAVVPPATSTQFTVIVAPVNNFSSSSVQFSVTGIEGWADWQMGTASQNTPYSRDVPISGVSIPLTITLTAPVTEAKTALVKAYDAGTGTSRTVTAAIVAGPDTMQAYSVSSGEPFKTVEKESATTFDVDLRGWYDYPNSNVTVSLDGWYDTSSPPAISSGPGGVSLSYSPSSSVQVRSGHNKTVKVTVGTSSATSTGQWLMKLRATDGTSSRDQVIYLAINIVAANTNPTVSLTSSFVNVLGYANFVITYSNNSSTPAPNLDNNTIYGYAVSPLVADPALLQMGMKARLIGWNQTR